MTDIEFVLYGFLLLILIFVVRRFLLVRSLKEYSPAEAIRKSKAQEALLLDVRTAAERKQGAINGSLHVPLHEIRRRMGELSGYKDREVICYCANGRRSISAAAMLKKAGFRTANMKGGITAMESAGLRA